MKRVLSLLFTAAMLLSVLGACGESAAPDAVTAAPSGSGATEAVTEAVTEPDYLQQYVGSTDFGGITYTFAVYRTDSYPNYTGEETSGEPVSDAQYARDCWVEENYNVALNYAAYEDNTLDSDIKKQVQAGDEGCHAIIGRLSDSLSPLSTAGMLYDLNQVDGLDLSADWWSRSLTEAYTIAGRSYVTTGPVAFSYYYCPRIIAFNLRLAENYGIGDLYGTVRDGKWTLDVMADKMKDVSEDLDGDGVLGDDDMWGASVDEYSAAGFFISAGGTQTAMDDSGKPYFVLGDERNVTILNKVASIIGNADMTQKAEVLASRSGTYDIRDKVYSFKNGKVLFLGYGAQAIALYLRDMEDDYGVLPVPMWDESQDGYITFGSSFAPCYLALPANNSLGSVNGVLLDSMGYISRRDVQPLITDVTLKGKAARDEESLEMIDLIYGEIYIDLNACYNLVKSFELVRNFCMGNTSDFVSAWAAMEPKATAELDKLYDTYRG